MKNILILLFGVLFLISCTGRESEKQSEVKTEQNAEVKKLTAKEKFETMCGICHWQKMPEKPVAPPVYNVRRRYLMQYPNEEQFVDAVSKWVEKPEHEKALLHGAVERFNVMPKLGYSKEDVKEIAAYIYKTEFPMPKGMGKMHRGQGRGGKGRMGKQMN